MTTLQSGIITLLRSAITQQPAKLPDNFCLDDAMPYIYEHNIQPLSYEGALLCGIPNSSDAMQKLFHSYCSAIYISSRQDAAIDRLFSAFEENKIAYIPLKGTRMRPLYPKPELRAMGDADVLIQVNEYEQIVPILQSLGYEHHWDNEWHYTWNSKDLNLELHHHLLSNKETNFYAMYQTGWPSAKRAEGSRWMLSDEDELIYMFEHFVKHYIKGVGIRQITDLWIYLRNHPDLDENYLTEKLTKLNRAEFYKNILHLLDVWFADATPNEMSDYLTDYIFQNGCWGTSENRTLGVLAKTTTKRNSARKQLMLKFLSFLFPGKKTIMVIFPCVRNHPVLYVPLMLFCPFYRVFFERGAWKRWLQTIKTYNSDKVSLKQSELEYVGLGNIR